jgi:hypothetical protein
MDSFLCVLFVVLFGPRVHDLSNKTTVPITILLPHTRILRGLDEGLFRAKRRACVFPEFTVRLN